MKRVVVTASEVAEVAEPAPGGRPESRLRPPIPLIVRIGLFPVLLVLPLLVVFGGITWLVVRNREPRLRHAWIHYLFGMFMFSSTVTIAVVAWFLTVNPAGLGRIAATQPFWLDTLTAVPEFKEGAELPTEELVRKMKPAVLIVSRGQPTRNPSRQGLNYSSFGAGVLLFAGERDYLIATARHVLDGKADGPPPVLSDVIVWGHDGGYAYGDIVGTHKTLDLALIRVPRIAGTMVFVQPVVPYPKIAVGGRVVAFGHPQGMYYTVSDGLVSRTDGDSTIQISAPISPGASGGPVYDLHGHLVGIISRSFDKQYHPQAENLNFAVRADALLQKDDWNTTSALAKVLDQFVAGSLIKEDTAPQPQPVEPSTKPNPKTDNSPP